MGDLQLYGMTNLALGEYRTFKHRSLNLLSISTAKELGIEMPPELVAGAYAVIEQAHSGAILIVARAEQRVSGCHVGCLG